MGGYEVSQSTHVEPLSWYGSLQHWMRFKECRFDLGAASRRCGKSYMTAERILRNAMLYGEFYENSPRSVSLKISYDEMMGFGGYEYNGL